MRQPVECLGYCGGGWRGVGTQRNACAGGAIMVKELAVIRADRQGNADPLLSLDPDAVAKPPGRQRFLQQSGQINAQVLHHG